MLKEIVFKNKKENKIIAEILDFAESFVIALILTFFITKFLIMPVRVDGSSMVPTISDNDMGFSSVISLKAEDVGRFDIVIIQEDEKKLVKRVIALPNETIQYKDNKLYINNQPLEEKFLSEEVIGSYYPTYTWDFSYQLKDNEYFCLGDNRANSKDSRFYGPFEKEQILAKGLFVIFPLSDFGFKK